MIRPESVNAKLQDNGVLEDDASSVNKSKPGILERQGSGLSRRDAFKRQMSKRGSMGSAARPQSSRFTLSRQDSGKSSVVHVPKTSSGVGHESSSQALLIGSDDDFDVSMSETSVPSGGQNGPTSAALPESISWRVTNSWKLVESKREKVGIEFFLSLFEEHPQAADLFHFGNKVMYSSGKINRRAQDVPKSLKIHARKVMDAVGLCVQGIEHLPDLVPTLRTLGTLHGSLGVQDFHYDVVYKHLMRAIEEEVGADVFDKETRIAWEIAYRSLTNVMKHPEAVLQIEPLEGWGVVNTVACAFLVIFTPLQMAGITRTNYYFNMLLSFLTFSAGLILVFDMSSHWIAQQVRPQASSNHAERSPLRRKFDIMIFPIQFRVVRFLRSLQMDRWAKWHGMESLILVSFPLQNAGYFFSAFSAVGYVGVHWTYLFGLLRLVAASRVLHSLTCAENNLLLRRRQISSQELLGMRMVKLIFTMLVVIHINACLWCIVARIGFGLNGIEEPVATSFFPKYEIFTGKLNPLNSYLHAVHWAWVCLAGIGDTDSNPESSLECLTTLFVHICGATLYTITTGNVVAILEAITDKQNEAGNDLAELGHFLQECNVPQTNQKQIMQGYMMHQLMAGGAEDEARIARISNRAPEAPEAVARLPVHLRQEIATYLRTEAMRRRDRGFAHCSHDFLIAFVGSLKQRMFLMADDEYVTEGEALPNQVALLVDGMLEVTWNDRIVRRLQVGDVIGKDWLVTASRLSSSSNKFGIRAGTVCTLIVGLPTKATIDSLRERFPKDFSLLKANQTSSTSV